MYSNYIILQKKICGAWRSSVARPAGGREVVGSNPAAPTSMEDKLKKVLLLFFSMFFIIIACSNEENVVYEPTISTDKIEFPFENISNGNFQTIFRNYDNESISFSVIMVPNGAIIEDSQNKDFCEGVLALRNNKQVMEWTPINFNQLAVAESQVPNENDHPNLISYRFPKGTYLVMLLGANNCSKDNYVVFDVLTNDALE